MIKKKKEYGNGDKAGILKEQDELSKAFNSKPPLISEKEFTDGITRTNQELRELGDGSKA